jgi:hypothetical protein
MLQLSYIDKFEQQEFNIVLQQWRTVCKKTEVRLKQRERLKMEMHKEQLFYVTSTVTVLKNKEGPIALLKPKNSKNILGIGCRENLLYILFNSKDIYTYEKVPFNIVLNLLSSALDENESTGKYFNENVKKRSYKYKNIGKFQG